MTISRRQFLGAAAIAAITSRKASGQETDAGGAWSLPIGNRDELPCDGFFIRHGYACENTWYNPGWWHTAEDWYRDGDADTAGAEVLAVLDGEVTWIGSDYPGRVILVLHDTGIYSMYGHLDFTVDVAEGERIAAGQVLGRVLAITDGRAPSHLHFEIRDFFTTPIVNGDSPKYDVGCGYRCPPGPGYWPIDDPRHPSEIGWRNPSHQIHRQIAAGDALPDAVVPRGAGGMTVPVRSEPNPEAATMSEITLRAGDRFAIAGLESADPATTQTSARACQVWYQLERDDDATGWLRALLPDTFETGSDGRPSSLRPVLLPVPAGFDRS